MKQTRLPWFWIGILIALCVLVVAITFIVHATHETPHSLPQSVPTQGFGMYEGCAPRNTVCSDHLVTMQMGGFTYVVNYAFFKGTPEAIHTYADRAANLRMHLIISFADPSLLSGTAIQLAHSFPEEWAACNCADRVTFIRYLIGFVNQLSPDSIWGYYIADEPTTHDFTVVAALSDFIYQLDPHHPRLIVTNSDTTLRQYAHSSLVSMIGRDYYPIGRSVDRTKSIESVSTVGHTLQMVATQEGLQSAIVLQAFSLSQRAKEPSDPYTTLCRKTQQCSFPTVQEMRQMRDLALHSTTLSLLLWYSYPYLFPPKADTSDRWQAVVKACNCESTK
ncbi:MAG: hypothetical protein NVS4B12_21610 [Ktedonobacteraceae bacterium]